MQRGNSAGWGEPDLLVTVMMVCTDDVPATSTRLAFPALSEIRDGTQVNL